MKIKIVEQLAIPDGVLCEIVENKIKCKKGDVELERKINLWGVKVKIENGNIIFECEKGNKNEYKAIKTEIAHIKNLYRGVEGKYAFRMQAVNVHFPMSLKVEGNKLSITNFLGEKEKRCAEILEGVDVQIKGQEVIVSSHDVEKAGKTAANIERMTKIAKKDRRVFQDGIFIVERGWGLK